MLVPVAILLPLSPKPFERARLAVQYPYQLDNEEGALLYQALCIKGGQTIYPDLRNYPYVAGTYTPLYMVLQAVLMGSPTPSFFTGRVTSAAACIGIAAIIFAIITLKSLNPVAGALGALVFVCSFEVYSWIGYYRVDLLALFFSMLAIGCVSVSPEDRWARVVSVTLFALAFYTKQTELVAAAAAVTAMFCYNWRIGLTYLTSLVAVIALSFAALSASTHGQFFLHTVLYNMNTYHPADLLVWARHAWLFYRWLVIAAVLGLAAVLAGAATATIPWRGRTDGARTSLSASDPIILFMVFSLAHYLAIAKAGSAENYLLEPLAAFALGVCYLPAMMARLPLEGLRRRAMTSAAVVMTIALGLHAARIAHPAIRGIMFSPAKNPTMQDFSAAQEVEKLVQSEPGNTWAELGFFNLAAGRSILFQPFIMSELARQKRWDSSSFCADLRDGKFDLVVTNHDVETKDYTDVYTGEMLEILRTRYQLQRSVTKGRLWKYYIYRPRRFSPLPPDVVMAPGAPSGFARVVCASDYSPALW
jgi:hypothetical protein